MLGCCGQPFAFKSICEVLQVREENQSKRLLHEPKHSINVCSVTRLSRCWSPMKPKLDEPLIAVCLLRNDPESFDRRERSRFPIGLRVQQMMNSGSLALTIIRH